ncbi:MAG: hypothetical protein WD557_03835 [Dehalococcoidia bacterium]
MTTRRSGHGRRWVALATSVAGLALGVLMVAAGGRGTDVAAVAEAPELEGEAWIMTGVAYNTQQPRLHHVTLPPGGTNDTLLSYNFDFSNQLILSASSSRVYCNGSGSSPGSTNAAVLCEVELHDFELWVGPYQIIEASYVRVASSSITGSNGNPISVPTIQIEGLCVYVEQDYANGCVVLGSAMPSIEFSRGDISGTVALGGTAPFDGHGSQLGAGSAATAFRVNLFNAGYTTSTGIGSVDIDIAHVETFAGEPWPTPTPTPTKTPTKTPTPTGTPSVFKALMPGLSKDD